MELLLKNHSHFISPQKIHSVSDKILKYFFLDDSRSLFGIIPFDSSEKIILFEVSHFKKVSRNMQLNIPKSEKIFWRSLTSEKNYLHQTKKILKDIQNGEYYELNFLRFFETESSSYKKSFLKNLVMDKSGEKAFYLSMPKLNIYSPSPERFIRIRKNKVETFPMKGTRKLNSRAIKKSLTEKEHAEMNLVIDLMRNDLSSICLPGTVKVNKQNQFIYFNDVIQNISHLKGELIPRLSLQQIFQNLLPPASITGAPKKKVLSAIKKYEKRKRGYFMGIAFFYDGKTKTLDSSVLIRTIVEKNKKMFLAVGSGLVLQSGPEEEFHEIELKKKIFNGDKV